MNYDGMRQEIEELFAEEQFKGRRLDFSFRTLKQRPRDHKQVASHDRRVDRQIKAARPSLSPFWATIEAEAKRRHAVEYARKRALARPS